MDTTDRRKNMPVGMQSQFQVCLLQALLLVLKGMVSRMEHNFRCMVWSPAIHRLAALNRVVYPASRTLVETTDTVVLFRSDMIFDFLCHLGSIGRPCHPCEK